MSNSDETPDLFVFAAKIGENVKKCTKRRPFGQRASGDFLDFFRELCPDAVHGCAHGAFNAGVDPYCRAITG